MTIWRTGRKVGRTVYEDDKLIGLMDTTELARLVVIAVNEYRLPPENLAALEAEIKRLTKLLEMAKGSRDEFQRRLSEALFANKTLQQEVNRRSTYDQRNIVIDPG